MTSGGGIGFRGRLMGFLSSLRQRRCRVAIVPLESM
jgi:hypothetical protein